MHEVESYRRHELDGSIASRAKLCTAHSIVVESLRLHRCSESSGVVGVEDKHVL